MGYNPTFLDLVINGKEGVPIEKEVDLIAAFEAAQKSFELGREVKSSEVAEKQTNQDTGCEKSGLTPSL